MTQQDNSLTGAITAVSTFVLLMLVFSYISFRSSRARKIIEGQPVVIVRDGKAMDEMLKIERMTSDEVEDAARAQGIRSLAQIEVGMLESDGSFSFITRDRAPRQQRTSSNDVEF